MMTRPEIEEATVIAQLPKEVADRIWEVERQPFEIF